VPDVFLRYYHFVLSHARMESQCLMFKMSYSMVYLKEFADQISIQCDQHRATQYSEVGSHNIFPSTYASASLDVF